MSPREPQDPSPDRPEEPDKTEAEAAEAAGAEKPARRARRGPRLRKEAKTAQQPAPEVAEKGAPAAEEAAPPAEEKPAPQASKKAAPKAEGKAAEAPEAKAGQAVAPTTPAEGKAAQDADAEAKGRAADEAEPGARRPAPAPTRPGARRTPRRRVVRARARYVRTSARKARMVCVHLPGKTVAQARAILAFTPREVARDWSKLLESAVANAEANHELVEDDLIIRAAYADEGPTIRRFRPRAMGRATPIRKRTSHLTIMLSPGEGERSNKRKGKRVS